MTAKEWRKFCDAAGLEEQERKDKVPKEYSQLTKSQRKLLKHAGESVKSPGARKLIERREKLIKHYRPQCVDPNDEEFEKALLEDLGLTAEEFKNIDKRLGPLEDWDELEELNKVEYEP
jgi:hypothetical protein